jgi:hypothetical protein
MGWLAALLILSGRTNVDLDLSAQGATMFDRSTSQWKQAVDGIHRGAATTFTHPRGWFSFEMPEGWSVTRQTDDSLLINPGLKGSDTLDAIVAVLYGEIDSPGATSDLAGLFEAVRPSVLQDLASQGIVVSQAPAAPRLVTLSQAKGLVQEWKATAGGRDVLVWLGGLASHGYYLAVSCVVISGREERVLPGVKRMLHSMQPRPPQRDHAAEEALVGTRFGSIDTRPGGASGSFSSILEFAAGNRVKKTLIVSGKAALYGIGGESEEWGTYAVVGDDLRLSFRDGEDVLRLSVERGQVVALQREGRIYRRR